MQPSTFRMFRDMGKPFAEMTFDAGVPWQTSAMSRRMTCCSPQGHWCSQHSQRWSIHSAMRKAPSVRSTPLRRSPGGSLCVGYRSANSAESPTCKPGILESVPEQRRGSMLLESSTQRSTMVWWCQRLDWSSERETSVPQQRFPPKWKWLPKWQRHSQLVWPKSDTSHSTLHWWHRTPPSMSRRWCPDSQGKQACWAMIELARGKPPSASKKSTSHLLKRGSGDCALLEAKKCTNGTASIKCHEDRVWMLGSQVVLCSCISSSLSSFLLAACLFAKQCSAMLWDKYQVGSTGPWAQKKGALCRRKKFEFVQEKQIRRCYSKT